MHNWSTMYKSQKRKIPITWGWKLKALVYTPCAGIVGGREESQKLSDSTDHEFQYLRGFSFGFGFGVRVIVIRCGWGAPRPLDLESLPQNQRWWDWNCHFSLLLSLNTVFSLLASYLIHVRQFKLLHLSLYLNSIFKKEKINWCH